MAQPGSKSTKQQRSEMYRRYLEQEGHAPKVDADGDVIFKHEGKTYLILVEDKDEEFFRVVYPNFWSIDNRAERARVVDAALQATLQTKVVKVFPVKDDTWAAIEMFCRPPEAFKTVFRRSLSALQAGVEAFREKMNE